MTAQHCAACDDPDCWGWTGSAAPAIRHDAPPLAGRGSTEAGRRRAREMWDAMRDKQKDRYGKEPM